MVENFSLMVSVLEKLWDLENFTILSARIRDVLPVLAKEISAGPGQFTE